MQLVFEIQGLWAYDAPKEKLAGTLFVGAAVWLSPEPHPKDERAIAVRLRGNSNAMLGYVPRGNIPEVSSRLIAGNAYDAKVTSLSTQKHRGTSQLSCQVALNFSNISTTPDDKKSVAVSVKSDSNITIKSCAQCDQFIINKPVILVEDAAYYYRCAKQLVPRLDQERKRQALNEFNSMMKPFASAKADFEAALMKWEKLRLETIQSTIWSDKLCGICAIAGAILGTADGIRGFVWGGIIAFVAALVLRGWDEDKLVRNFTKNYPQPIFDLEEPVCPLPIPVSYFFLPPSSESPIMSREEILKRDNYTCQACGQRKKAEKLEVHHVLPKSKNGSDTAGNLVTLCLHCHDREDWFGHVRAYPTTFPKRRPFRTRFRRFR